MRSRSLIVLLCGTAIVSAGCGNKHIVSATPPSVSGPFSEDRPPEVSQPVPTATPDATTAAAPADLPPEPPPTPAARPVARPRPTQNENPVPPAPVQPKPAPPQIAPALTDAGLAAAQKSTTSSITTAENDLKLVMDKENDKKLSANQKAVVDDLVDKINGFLAQAHEAILANDWVRAQNLAEKARVLSVELMKSF
jgi:hypothetical protein